MNTRTSAPVPADKIGMTKLTGITPTPEQFGAGWVQEFGDVIIEAGGADGRVSRASAERIATRRDAGRLAADNAVAFFDRTGQKTVSAKKLRRVLGEEATTAGAAIAGPNQRISLREGGERLPVRLRADFLYLRGKGVPDTRTHADFVADATAQVRSALGRQDAQRLSGPPWQVRNQRPIAQFYEQDLQANIYVYTGRNELYYSLGASARSPSLPQVGWYHVGAAPEPPQIA